MKLREMARVLIEWGGSLRIPPAGLAAVFCATVIARNVLESVPSGLLFPPEAFLYHFPIAYVFPMLGIVAALHLLSGHPASALLRIMVLAWTLTLLPPIIDAVAGTTSPIGYFPLDADNAAGFIVNFFNPGVTLPGTTTGIRIEAAAGCLLGGIFTFAAAGRARTARGVLAAVVLAPLFLVFFAWPGLVHWAFRGLFPRADGIQDFLQWHSATAPHLAGSAHMTVFIVDSWPVAGLAALLAARAAPETWRQVRGSAAASVPMLGAAAAGLAAAVAGVSGTAVTFADAAAVSGAFLSASMTAVSVEAGRAGTVLRAWALLLASAVGWTALVAAAAAVSAVSLPVPRRARVAAACAILPLLAASPVFAGLSSLGALWPLSLAALPAAWGGRLRIASAVPVAAAIALSIRPAEPAQRSWLAWTTDGLSRSARNSHAHVSASLLAGAGGSTVPLAHAAHLSGRMPQARWLWRLSGPDGGGDPEMIRLGLNIAMTDGDAAEMQRLMGVAAASGMDLGSMMPAVLSSAAARGDTSMISMVARSGGPAPLILAAHGRALLALGDTAGASAAARSVLRAPGASPADWAFSLELEAASGGRWEQIAEEGLERFGMTPDLLLSAVRADAWAGGCTRPDRMRMLLGSFPVTPEALAACAGWLLAAGMPDSALAVAERAACLEYPPDEGILLLAASCARAAGRGERALIHMEYLEETGESPVR